MLCLFIFILPEVALSQNISTENLSTVELTSTAEVVENEPVVLTCTVQGQNLTNLSSTITWFITRTAGGKAEVIHDITLSNTTSSEYEISPSPNGQSGQYYCEVDGVASNNVTIYVRDFTMKQLPTEASVYKDQLVEISLVQHGDTLDDVSCNKPHSSVSLNEFLLEAKIKFTAESSVTVTCEAYYGDGDVSVERSVHVKVLVPTWSPWSNYSELCEIRPDKEYQCARMRNRTCIHHSSYSSCEGLPNSFLDCLPDDCEPYVTDWGDWGDTCEFDVGYTDCRRSRERVCTVAVNSTRTCSDELVGYTPCDEAKCDVWSDWLQWSRCHQLVSDSTACVRERQRHCLFVGRDCAGANSHQKTCDAPDCAPKFKNYGIKTIRRSYQEDFFLVCNVEPSYTVGYRGMLVQWKRNSYIIEDSANVTTDTLRYTDVRLLEDETGIYVCCVRNEFGSRCNDGWEIHLNNFGPVPTGIDQVVPRILTAGSNYSLQCELDGYLLDYEWYKGVPYENRIPDQTTQWLKILDMSKEDRGRYSCCAVDNTSGSQNTLCSLGYEISEPENTQRKYLIITITVIILLILGLVLYITCVHTNKMNSFKRRFRHMFASGHTKLYNGLDQYGTGQVIQRSQSYLKRLSKTRPLSKSELALLVQLLGESTDPNCDYHENNELGMEFESVPNNSITINKTPVGTESKNRYLNVLPNPHSRVLLPEIGTDPTSTYVNANYIRGYKLAPKEYVATQGPLPSTSSDFWRLVWEEKCRIIVMTTGLIENSRMKCSLYWPTNEIGDTLRSGEVDITQLGIFPSKYYTISIMRVRRVEVAEGENNVDVEEGERNADEEQQEHDLEDNKTQEETLETMEKMEDEGRIIYHLWYHSWPDFGVPEDTGPFLDFVESVRSFKAALESAPVLVHCSAGIGRTGTFISVNLGIEQFQDNGKVDPLGYICQLRQDRGGMIQTLDQYTFVYRALYAYQQRLAQRDKESKDKTLIKCGPYTLQEDNVLLPKAVNLPIVEDIEGSKVDAGFIKSLTQTIRSVSRYSDSIASVNNMSVKVSTESLNRDNTSGSLKCGAHKPLISADVKQKRRSKVKSLFFPLSPKDKSKRGSSASSDFRYAESPKRSLSLNNVKYSKSRESVCVSPRVSLCSSNKRVSVSSSKSAGTECSIKIEN